MKGKIDQISLIQLKIERKVMNKNILMDAFVKNIFILRLLWQSGINVKSQTRCQFPQVVLSLSGEI